MLKVCPRFKKVGGTLTTWTGEEREWKTLAQILQGDAADRRKILYFRDVAVGWMEAPDVDVLSRARVDEPCFSTRSAEGFIIGRRECPREPKDFQWETVVLGKVKSKRFEQPPEPCSARPTPSETRTKLNAPETSTDDPANTKPQPPSGNTSSPP